MTVISADISPDGRWIAAGIEGNAVKLWENGQPSRTDTSSEYQPAAYFTFDGHLLVSTGAPSGSNASHSLTIRDTATGSVVGTLGMNDHWSAGNFDLSPVAPVIAVNRKPVKNDPDTIADEDIAGFDMSATPFRQFVYPIPKGWGHRLTFTPDGRFLAVCCELGITEQRMEHDTGGTPYKDVQVLSEIIRLWNVETNEPGQAFTVPCSVSSIAFSRNGRWMATGCHDSYYHQRPRESAPVILWDRRNGQQIGALQGHITDVISVAFSPDDRLLATGSIEILVWETAKWSVAWHGDPCRNWTGSLTWTAGLNWNTSGDYLLANCSRSIMLLRHMGEPVVPSGPAPSLKIVPLPRLRQPISQDKLLSDLSYVVTMAGERRLNELKDHPDKEVALSKFAVDGVRSCVIAPDLPGSDTTTALSIRCYFDALDISLQDLFAIAQRAAPQLKWGDPLVKLSGADAEGNEVIVLSGDDNGSEIEIVESH